MDREEFRDQLRDLGMDCATFARETGWSRDTVREWGRAGSPVPRQARVMVGLLKRVQPPPSGGHEGGQ